MSPSCAGDSMPGSFYFAVLSRLPFHTRRGEYGEEASEASEASKRTNERCDQESGRRESCLKRNVCTAAVFRIRENLTQAKATGLIRQHPGYEPFRPRAIFSRAARRAPRAQTVRNGIAFSLSADSRPLSSLVTADRDVVACQCSNVPPLPDCFDKFLTDRLSS